MDPYLNTLTFQLFGFALSLMMVALFAFLETCITAIRIFKLKEMSETVPNKYKPLLQSLQDHPNRMLITILVAVSLANVTCAALATQMMEQLFARLQFSQGLGFSLGIAITTGAILIFGEIIPKSFAKSYGESLFRSTLWISNGIFYLLYPFVTFLMKISNFVMSRVAKQPNHATNAVSSEKEIKFMINYIEEQGLMDPDKGQMLRNVLNMGQTPVLEIMVPMQDVVSINVNGNIGDAVQTFSKHHFSRLPVYKKDHDNIIGFIHQKDVLLRSHKNKEECIEEIMRTIPFVPASMKASQLLTEFKQKKEHIAMVLNEFGSIIGLATLEDAIEEIVGDIYDEYETTAQEVVTLDDGSLLVNAGIDLQDLGGILNTKFNTKSITLGGFLSEQLQHVPKKGEYIEHNDYLFQVQKASQRRVLQVLVYEETKQLQLR